jgi:hypothetical protein
MGSDQVESGFVLLCDGESSAVGIFLLFVLTESSQINASQSKAESFAKFNHHHLTVFVFKSRCLQTRMEVCGSYINLSDYRECLKVASWIGFDASMMDYGMSLDGICFWATVR